MEHDKPQDLSDVLMRATSDLRAKWPGEIRITWDGGRASGAEGPHMVTLVAQGARVRVFVEHSVVVERGALYDEFLEKAVQTLSESIAKQG